MEQRSQFTFYESFFNALSRIKKDADRAKAYDAICAYALYGTEPDMDALPDSAAISFELVKPNLDSSRRKANSGKRGGEKKQSVSEENEEANGKQTGSKPKAKRKQSASEKENKKEKEKENECYNPLTPSQAEKFSPFLLEAVNEWLRYKHERKEDYKPTGLEAMTTEIGNRAAQHGDVAVANLIRHCMAQNWKGIIWEKIGEQAQQRVKPASKQTGPFAASVQENSAADDIVRMLAYRDQQRRGMSE